jgi:hypothetical protein
VARASPTNTSVDWAQGNLGAGRLAACFLRQAGLLRSRTARHTANWAISRAFGPVAVAPSGVLLAVLPDALEERRSYAGVRPPGYLAFARLKSPLPTSTRRSGACRPAAYLHLTKPRDKTPQPEKC